MSMTIHTGTVARSFEQAISKFVWHRYSKGWIKGTPLIDIKVDYLMSKLAYLVSLTIDNTWRAEQLYDSMVFEQYVGGQGEWMEYMLQNVKHSTDTAIFYRWLHDNLDHDGKVLLRERCQGMIEEVTYVPPSMAASMHEVNSNWLACVKFKNGAVHREILGAIERDADTFLARLLMLVH